MLINSNSAVCKVLCGFVGNAKILEFTVGTVKLHGAGLQKIMLHMLVFKLKNEIYNSELDSAEKDLDEQISNL